MKDSTVVDPVGMYQPPKLGAEGRYIPLHALEQTANGQANRSLRSRSNSTFTGGHAWDDAVQAELDSGAAHLTGKPSPL